MKEFFIIGDKFDPEVDSKMFDDTDVLTPLIDSDKTMAHLLARLGKFKSIGDARKNGWDKPIPIGYEELSIGRGPNQMKFFIWNPSCTQQEYDIERSSNGQESGL